jgi:hypothetical protein
MFEMVNPFKYGTVVSGKDFVDREGELKELAREIRGGKSVVLYSNRRMGKSSLLLEFSKRHSREFIFVRIDLYGLTEQSRFLEAVVKETSRAAFGVAEKFASSVWKFLKGTNLRLVVTESGELGVEFSGREPSTSDVAGVFDLPEKAARRRKRRLVVIFDEFQEIAYMDGVGLLKQMRSRFQNHHNVVYVFSGSKKHLLHQIFEEREGAFFKFARPMELDVIPNKQFEDFLISRFKGAGGNLDRATARMILRKSKGHPYYTQQIAHELFDISKNPSGEGDVEKSVRAAVDHQSPAYTYMWESVKSPLHRRYLKAIASEPGVVHGHEFIERHRLRSTSHIQRIENQLEARGIIERGEIVDPLFAVWLLRIKTGL